MHHARRPTGSESLREWASRELMGYGNDDELPEYRKAAATLVLDAHLADGRVTGQQVPYNLIPDFARDHLGDELDFRQPISEIAEMLSAAGRRGESTVKLGVPLGSGVVGLMNDELRKAAQPQGIERIYWDVSLVPLTRILDGVRTRLVALIAEMRAGTPIGRTMQTREVAEHAVGLVIHGGRRGSSRQRGGPWANPGRAMQDETSQRRGPRRTRHDTRPRGRV